MRAPTAWNFAGSFRNSLISWSSSISSAPATSSNVTFAFVTSLAFDLPNCMTRLPPPCMPESMIQKKRPMRPSGSRMPSIERNQFGCGTSSLKPSDGFASSTAAITS